MRLRDGRATWLILTALLSFLFAWFVGMGAINHAAAPRTLIPENHRQVHDRAFVLRDSPPRDGRGFRIVEVEGPFAGITVSSVLALEDLQIVQTDQMEQQVSAITEHLARDIAQVEGGDFP